MDEYSTKNITTDKRFRVIKISMFLPKATNWIKKSKPGLTNKDYGLLTYSLYVIIEKLRT